MKLIHLSDLHLGKRLNEFNIIEDQRYILDQILQIVNKENPDGILIAGDVYDKSQPSSEAVELLDNFLTNLTSYGKPIFIISGNHDSPERLNFGSRIMQKNGLHIAGIFDGFLQKIAMTDEYGILNIYQLPFIKPAMVKPFFEHSVETYDDALRTVLSAAHINTQERNVLLAHQFVSSGSQQPERSESETLSIGGLDNVDFSVFDEFDYVALGHLHGPQRIGRDTVRYAGSPLKYSFSESRHRKTAAMIDIKTKDSITINLLPLSPLRDLREIKGPIAELLRIGHENTASSDDYIHATLTDEEDIYDAIGQMRQVYPNLMTLDFDNRRSKKTVASSTSVSGNISLKSPVDLFSDFYSLQNNTELTYEQQEFMGEIFRQAGGDNV